MNLDTRNHDDAARAGAERLLLGAAKTAGWPVRVKPSGGVRSLADAMIYLALGKDL